METNELILKLEKGVPGAVLEARPFGRTAAMSVWIEMQSIVRVAKFIREDPEISLDWLENMSAMDIDQAFVLSYFLRSTSNSNVMILRGSVVPTSADDEVVVTSVADIWPMSRLPEREIADLFGIRFGKSTPSARTILPEGWMGYPLRKSYVFPAEYLDILHMRPPGQGAEDAGVCQ